MVTRTGHMAFRVPDLDAAVAFQREVIGMVETERTAGAAYLTCNERHHELILIQDPVCRGYDHIALEVEDAQALELPEDAKLAYITQTTLSVDETAEIIEVLKRRFPHIRGPQREDICYATSNRQWAVKELLGEVDLLLVIGSRNSSNSNRLVDVAHAAGVQAYLIDDWFRAYGVPEIRPFASVYEDVVFRLPVELRRAETPAA
jgi:4-hydroxy-3-methylbut-2-enyl diphosphate reductase